MIINFKTKIDLGISLIFFSLGVLFPLQVFLGSNQAAVIPYILLLLYYLKHFRELKIQAILSASKRLNFIIFYFFLFFIHSVFQLYADYITFREFCRLCFVYILPVFFYVFARMIAFGDLRLTSAFLGILIGSILGSFYMTYDSVSKMIFSEIPLYSKLASNYITDVNRIFLNDPKFIDISGRSIPNNRSFGLLESASVSATFIAFGFFSLVYLFKYNSQRYYFIYGLLYIAILVSSMNFTSIFVFLIVFSFSILFFLIYSSKFNFGFSREKVFMGLIFSFTIVVLLLILLPNHKVVFLGKVFLYPFNLIFSKDLHPKNHYPSMIVFELRNYIIEIRSNPLLLFIGDGFSTKFGHQKGSDLGFIESIYRFGLPFCISALFILYKALLKFKDQIKKGEFDQCCFVMQISLSVILFICLMEIHYSVYQSKSVLPILFFFIGLFPNFSRKQLNF
jgi:hypothetical protein